MGAATEFMFVAKREDGSFGNICEIRSESMRLGENITISTLGQEVATYSSTSKPQGSTGYHGVPAARIPAIVTAYREGSETRFYELRLTQFIGYYYWETEVGIATAFATHYLGPRSGWGSMTWPVVDIVVVRVGKRRFVAYLGTGRPGEQTDMTTTFYTFARGSSHLRRLPNRGLFTWKEVRYIQGNYLGQKLAEPVFYCPSQNRPRFMLLRNAAEEAPEAPPVARGIMEVLSMRGGRLWEQVELILSESRSAESL